MLLFLVTPCLIVAAQPYMEWIIIKNRYKWASPLPFIKGWFHLWNRLVYGCTTFSYIPSTVKGSMNCFLGSSLSRKLKFIYFVLNHTWCHVLDEAPGGVLLKRFFFKSKFTGKHHHCGRVISKKLLSWTFFGKHIWVFLWGNSSFSISSQMLHL